MKKKINLNPKLDQQEQEWLDSLEQGEWKSVNNLAAEIKKYQQIASNTLRRDQRVNIRLNKADLSALKYKAAEEGIPYQTLISSILHKYLSVN